MVQKFKSRSVLRANRHRVSFRLADFLNWRDAHPRLFDLFLALFVVLLVGLTLLWQTPSIAQKLASNGLDNYFKQDILSEQKDDRDRDGLTDSREAELQTDPDNPDTDGDGLLDGEEVNIYKTNPLAVDTDGDGYSDAMEVFTGHDPNRASGLSGQSVGGKLDSAPSDSAVDAENLASLSQLLNGADSSGALKLSDLNMVGVTDLSSVFGAGNAAEILVADTDIKIMDVPENEAKAKVETYLSEVGELMMEIFSEEFNDPKATQNFIQTVVSSGQFDKLEQKIKKSQLFSDRIVAIAVPRQAKEFHKSLLKVFLETHALGKNLQNMESDSLASLVVLEQVAALENDLAEFQQLFNQLSVKYELGYQLSEVNTSVTTNSD